MARPTNDPAPEVDPLAEEPAFTVDCVALAREYSLRGLGKRQIARELGITMATLRRWRLLYPSFAEALDEWREEADDDVERALWVQAQVDTSAARFWLTNRKADQWRNKQEVDQHNTGTVQVVTGVPARANTSDAPDVG